MSLDKLIGGDCGGNNALVQLSSIVRRDGIINQQVSQADQFVNEFMSQSSQTFNMNALLNNMPAAAETSSLQNKRAPDLTYMAPSSSTYSPGPSGSFMPYQPMFRSMFMPPQQQIVHQGPSNVQIQYVNESEYSLPYTCTYRVKTRRVE